MVNSLLILALNISTPQKSVVVRIRRSAEIANRSTTLYKSFKPQKLTIKFGVGDAVLRYGWKMEYCIEATRKWKVYLSTVSEFNVKQQKRNKKSIWKGLLDQPFALYSIF